MTTPDERYRALRWAHEFMLEQLDARPPAERRRELQAILRHYPTEQQLDAAARRYPDWLQAPGEAATTPGDAHGPN